MEGEACARVGADGSVGRPEGGVGEGFVTKNVVAGERVRGWGVVLGAGRRKGGMGAGGGGPVEGGFDYG